MACQTCVRSHKQSIKQEKIYDRFHDLNTSHYTDSINPVKKKKDFAGQSLPSHGIQPKPIILSELEQKFEPIRREAFLSRFAKIKDPVFDVSKQHPILRRYLSEVTKVTDAKPAGLVSALLPALACCIGNHAYIMAFSVRHYCNIWTINIAKSTVGRKTTGQKIPLYPLNKIQEYLTSQWKFECQLAQEKKEDEPPEPFVMLPTSTTERLYEMLEYNQNSLMVFSEIASFFSKMGKSYNSDFKSDITDMYDTPERPFRHQTRTRKVSVEKPCFSISAATTKQWLLKELDADNKADIYSGFMQRFLICNSYDIDKDTLNFSYKEGGVELETLYKWLSFLCENLRHIGTQENPIKLTLSQEAADLYEAVNREIFTKLLEQDDNDILLSYAGRIFNGYFFRLCILFHLSQYVCDCFPPDKQPEQSELIVSETTARYAFELCRFYFDSVSSFLKNDVSEHEQNEDEKKVYDAFVRLYKETGEPVCERRDLIQRAYVRPASSFDEAVKGLIEQKIMMPCKIEGSKATWYRLLQIAEDS